MLTEEIILFMIIIYMATFEDYVGRDFNVKKADA